MGKLTTILKLESVSLIKNRRYILKDISWEIKKGEHWVVLGSNGSGKTMLLKMLSGYTWPSKGSIEVLGERFGNTDIGNLRKLIGWVSFDLQNKLQEFSAIDIVMSGYFASIGLYKKVGWELVKEAKRLLEFIGLKGLEKRSFQTLSYGEQKRILIARSLINKPKLLMLDEPCSGLDLKARDEFLKFIDRLAKKANCPTIILVTHHLEEIVPSINNVLVLKKGRIIAEDKRKNFLDDELIKKIYE